MKSRIQILACFGGAAILLFSGALTVLSQDPSRARELIETKNEESLRVRYARANVRLAQMDLEIILAGNEKVTNLHSMQTIQRLRDNVAYAQDWHNYEINQSKEHLRVLRLRDVERRLKLAESDLAAAIIANQHVSGSVANMEIERLRATVEISRLAFDMASEPGMTLSSEDQLRWQVEQLRWELTRLYVQLEEVVSHH